MSVGNGEPAIVEERAQGRLLPRRPTPVVLGRSSAIPPRSVRRALDGITAPAVR
jgi:hypothetical protein